MNELAIETRDLVRTYRIRKSPTNPSGAPVVALDGVTLDIPRGEFFGLLGPNGAGKTTFIKVLVTLLLPTSGSAHVAGLDVVGQAQQVRERISMVSGGEHSGYGLLTVREQLWMFSQFYGLPTRPALARIDELLRRTAGGTYFVRTTEPLDGIAWVSGVPGVQRADARVTDGRTELRLQVADDGAIAGVVKALADRERRIFSLQKIEPSLEDVFVQIVGRRLEEADEGGRA